MNLLIPTIFQVCSASISFAASFIIIIMVAIVADGGLLSPYRRIIFALSVSDVLKSGALIIGPLSVPRGTSQSPWAFGSEATCESGGFFLLIGILGTEMYICALCVYYLYKTKYGFTNDEFKNRIEFKMHGFIVLFSTCMSFSALVTDNFSVIPTRSTCYLAAFPSFCREYPEVVGECTRGLQSKLYIAIATYTIPTICLCGIVTTIIMICCHVSYKQRLINHSGASRQAERRTLRSWVRNVISLFHERREDESEADYLSRHFLGEQVTQVVLYVVGFVLASFLTWTAQTMYLFGQVPTDGLFYAMPLFYPLGGIFNIIVYTRPSVKTLRTRYSEYSWFKAFWLVLKAGAGIPSVEPDSRRSRSEEKTCSCCLRCFGRITRAENDGINLGRVFHGLSEISSSEMTTINGESNFNFGLSDNSAVGSSRIRSTSACRFESDEKLSVIEELSVDSQSIEFATTSLQSVPEIEDMQHYGEARQMMAEMHLKRTPDYVTPYTS